MNKPDQPMSALSLKLSKANVRSRIPRKARRSAQPQRALGRAHCRRSLRGQGSRALRRSIWDKTIAFREHLWDLRLGVAEAMDTAQRGMGLNWPTSLELITRSASAAKRRNALVFSGSGTDHLAVEDAKTIDDVIRAYEEQSSAIEKVGARIILMASRALAKLGRTPTTTRRYMTACCRRFESP